MIGLDIGSKTIKLVELKKEGTSFELVATGATSITGIPVDKMTEDKDFSAVAQIIKKLHKEAGFSSRDVTLSVPESQVFTRTIKFPLLTDMEIASAVKWESEQYIPIPVEEAIVQHTILERNETGTPPGVTVLLVAAPRVMVEKYVKIVTLAGLNPIAVESELIALSRSVAPKDKTVIVVDVGAASTDLAIVKNTMLSFSRSIPTAGDALTRAVSQGLGVTGMQAEEYKKTYGLMQNELEGKVKKALDPILRIVTDEIKKAIYFYQTEEKGESPQAVVICGGSTGMPQIVSAFTELLGMEALVANPFSQVQMDPETMKKLAPFAPLYGVAIGLAMREE